MTRWTLCAVASLGLALATPLTAQSGDAQDAIVIVTGQLATQPIPTIMDGPAATTGNYDVADQLFLRLAVLGPSRTTAGDRGFRPVLAKSWTRRDSLTLVFDLDERARWHDGRPVTSRDVVLTFDRARDAQAAPRLSRLLQHIASVTADGPHRVVIRFAHAYPEQFYDATFHVQPLPAHLVGEMTPEQLRQSDFVRNPVGNGPYRWVRAVPGQFVELAANRDFFLGRPQIDRVLFRVASNADARINLMLSGEGDALENVIPPLANLERLAARPELRLVRVPSASVGYILFNYRDRADSTRPHPILGDLAVRRAIGLALDRQAMVKSAFGPYAEVPFGPVSPMLWIRRGAGRPHGQNVGEARRLLAGAGWRDSDGDGILDREGRPLALSLNYPGTSAVRKQMALQTQEQLRRVGIRLDLVQLEFPVWIERRSAGDFDLDFSSATQDPTPSGLRQSWTCAGIGGSNVGRFCDPAVDSLIRRATLTQGDPTELWHAALRRIEADAPAIFMYAPINVYIVSRRFDDVEIRPESSWLRLHDWAVRSPSSGR